MKMLYITGIGRTKFGVLPQTLQELAYEAMYNAVMDSKLSINDIDAIFVSNFLGGPLNGQLHFNSIIASLLPGINIPIVRIETACASSSIALKQALYSLSQFENVMVLGVEKMTSKTILGTTEAIAMAADRCLDQQNGLIFPAAYALIAQQYMLKYGINHDILEQVSFINHKNSRLNPLAHFFYKDVTIETIRKSPIIATPLNLFDCSPISDGAAAIIVSKEKKSDRDIEVLSSQYVTDAISITQREDLTSFKATRLAAKKAYSEAGLKPDDIDILEVHDCFTISELIALEDLGFCKPGESSELVINGDILKDGRIPVNMDGGLKANGHPIGATGLAQIYEIVVQLRGEAGIRQIKNANIGMAQNIGGIGGTAAITILGRS
ncbi:thiolase domain-containing protein [Methanocella conradii]|uniref:thiolase domain-containing protein n=1 Tax=Methanocella conradii TaxID=1175444 RepID=UPI0024B31FC7|nr:thiolase domain-containing protein [Methanocella conradii]MDI6895978.1 thiolase domain-containing protein [Methanocella conradii]